MILTITPNLALDITYTLDHLAPGHSHRATTVTERAGGKGVNVARILTALGHPALVLGPAGGHHGHTARAELDHAGLPHDLTDIRGTTRRTVTLVCHTSGHATLINEPGPDLTTDDWHTVRQRYTDHLPQATVAVCAGSLPPGAPTDAYAQLITLARHHGVPSILDTSGPALHAGLAAGPDIAKPNATELAEITGTTDPHTAARHALRAGARAVAVSLGPDGLLAATPTGTWQAHPPQRLTGNPTGAGDAAVAALAVSLTHGHGWPELLRDAVALSAAAVLAPLAGDVNPAHYERQRSLVRIHAPGNQPCH